MSHENNLLFILFWDGANNIQSCMMCCMSAIKTVLTIACSETLYFLFKVRRARVIKYKPQVIYWPSAHYFQSNFRLFNRTECKLFFVNYGNS